MSAIGPLIARMGEGATHLIQTIGLRDPITGHPAITWTLGGTGDGDFDCGDFDCDDFDCGGCIRIMVKSISSRELDPPAGRVTEERLRVYTAAEINHLDRIIYHGITYEIETQPVRHYLRGNVGYRDAVMVRVS